MSEKTSAVHDWAPLVGKLVWPFFISILLIIFRQDIGEIYSLSLERIKSGGSFEIPGFFKLGEAARNTEIQTLIADNLSIEAIGGPAGVVRKRTEGYLQQLRSEIERSPTITIDTLLVDSSTPAFSVDLIKKYIGTLGLRYAVFQDGGQFDGWISANVLVAQLPQPEDESVGTRRDISLSYSDIRSVVSGIRLETVKPNDSAKSVLERMQALHVEHLPVVDSNGKWLFFTSRGEILARLMTGLLLESKDTEASE